MPQLPTARIGFADKLHKGTCPFRQEKPQEPGKWSPEGSEDMGEKARYSRRKNSKSLRPEAYRSARGELRGGHPCRSGRIDEPPKPPHGSRDIDSSARGPAFHSRRTDATPRPAPEKDS